MLRLRGVFEPAHRTVTYRNHFETVLGRKERDIAMLVGWRTTTLGTLYRLTWQIDEKWWSHDLVDEHYTVYLEPQDTVSYHVDSNVILTAEGRQWAYAILELLLKQESFIVPDLPNPHLWLWVRQEVVGD